jgi:hypothetical protein
MIKGKFSNWVCWVNRNTLGGIQNPGVYALALSTRDISGKPFDWIEEIIYFGMTNSGGGLKARLTQFDNTIKGKEGHGGGERVRYKYRDYTALSKKLFVSVYPIECDVKSNRPQDLLKMGKVAYLEYYCLSKYVDLFGHLPEFNDKKNAPKLTAMQMKSANKPLKMDEAKNRRAP